MKTTFEDRLLDALKHEVERSAAERPEPVRRRVVTPRRAAFGLAACAAAATVGIVVPGAQGGSTAYAVEKHGDGTVTVTVNDLTLDRAQQQALAAKLRTEGARASIQNPAKGHMCVEPDTEDLIGNSIYSVDPEVAAYQKASKEAHKGDPESMHPWSVTLRPGDTMVIRNVQGFKGYSPVTYFYGTHGKADPCKPLAMHPFNPPTETVKPHAKGATTDKLRPEDVDR
ncbi:hypothetical protein [Streptomyces odontomachi]|uniref:hypothetical protein n=1 Tax=Streptomyces odontomachi TaxID=2944940 RepID=UPI00210B2D3B|nr:hypothetical protein [Streptomyces sp. ODS25]